jgi:thiosulfate/3-mercaptopyruvate sulfurtransferase
MSGYAHSEMLVDTAWVDAHRRDAGVRIAEVDVDSAAYDPTRRGVTSFRNRMPAP